VSPDRLVEPHRPERAAAVDGVDGEESSLLDRPFDPSNRISDRRLASIGGFLAPEALREPPIQKRGRKRPSAPVVALG
jgi:hypothetical protein